jgi:ubiquinone/menaquinone biosynthesis C-methylase UbiE
MTGSDKAFLGSIPEIYDRFLVPLIFEPYADDLAERLFKTKSQSVLEIAAGTGVLTRAIAARASQDVHLTATDLNQPMLDRAMTRQPRERRVEWRQADGTALPFGDRTFDAVLCQFGVMFFPDKVQGYKEARRVLKPGGRYLFNVWDRMSENEFPDVVTDALASVFPGDPPRFMVRTPHGHYDPDKIRDELQAAGFTNISIEPLDKTSKAQTSLDAAIDFCQGTPLRNEIEARDPSRIEEATHKAADALATRFGSGAIEGRIRALVITAIR